MHIQYMSVCYGTCSNTVFSGISSSPYPPQKIKKTSFSPCCNLQINEVESSLKPKPSSARTASDEVSYVTSLVFRPPKAKPVNRR